MAYTVGMKLIYEYEEDGKPERINGVVVDNVKLPGDICVQWETGQFSSYDEEWLDENAVVAE